MKMQFQRMFHGANRGFTLLLAALVAAIVLALGSSVFTIAQKQIILSSIGRDSQFAFYAADTGAECALFWDLRQAGTFATSTASTPTGGIACDGVSVPRGDIEILRRNGNSATSQFQVDLFRSGSIRYCVVVTVQKSSSNPFTVIHSDGYSVRCADIETSSRSLQRSVELRY